MSAAVTAQTDLTSVSGVCRSAVTFDDNDDHVRILSPVTSPLCDDAISGRAFCRRNESADLHVEFSFNPSTIDNDVDDEGNALDHNEANHVTDINWNNTAGRTAANARTGSGDSRRFLTAKYPKHRTGMIRRRIAVEDWIDDELKKLHHVVSQRILAHPLPLHPSPSSFTSPPRRAIRHPCPERS